MTSRRKYRKSPGRIEKEKRYQILSIYERFYYRYDRWWLQQHEFYIHEKHRITREFIRQF